MIRIPKGILGCGVLTPEGPMLSAAAGQAAAKAERSGGRASAGSAREERPWQGHGTKGLTPEERHQVDK